MARCAIMIARGFPNEHRKMEPKKNTRYVVPHAEGEVIRIDGKTVGVMISTCLAL
jgi:hypothetical protein